MAPASAPALIPPRPAGEAWHITKPAIENAGGLIASQHRLASEAGAEILARGGNAVDAAIAASFVLATVEPWMSGLGGGGYMAVLQSNAPRAQIVDFGMVAPASLDSAAYPLTGEAGGDMFSWPAVLDNRNLKGFLSIALPTQVAGLALALEKFGTRSWAELLTPAIASAEAGMEVDWYATIAIAAAAADLAQNQAAGEVYLPTGFPPAGQWSAPAPRIHLGNLAETLRRLGEAGADDFYSGEIARRIVADLSAGGCPVSVAELAAYRARIIDVEAYSYRGAHVFAPPGMTAGPTLKSALEALQSQPVPSGTPGAEAYHRFASCLTDATRARLDGAGDDGGQSGKIRTESCTSHISVVDSAGTVVALTQTLLSPFGSKIILPQSGILMNNDIMWFDPRPGQPNSIGPGKRPLSNMCPAIVETPNGLRIALGASGGRRILPAVLQLICFLVDHGMSAEQALHQPRIDVGGAEGVAVDCRLPDDVFAALNTNFETSWARHGVYPALFACPNMAVWDAVRKRAYGAAYVPSPRAAVASVGELENGPE